MPYRLLSTEISNHEPTRKPIRLPPASIQHRQPGPRLQRRPGPHGLLNIIILIHYPTYLLPEFIFYPYIFYSCHCIVYCFVCFYVYFCHCYIIILNLSLYCRIYIYNNCIILLSSVFYLYSMYCILKNKSFKSAILSIDSQVGPRSRVC